MRILHINSYFNAGRFYRYLYDGQVARGDDISVYLPVVSGDKWLDSDYGSYTQIAPIFTKLDRLFFHHKNNKAFRDALQRYQGEQLDVIHAHSLFSNGYVAMQLSQKLGIPYIVAVRNADVRVFFKKMPHLRALGRRILQGASKVIFMSKPYRDDALKPYMSERELCAVKAKSAVIPNGLDPFWLQHLSQPKPQPTGGNLRLLLIGTADRNKNIPVALSAARELMARGRNVRFDIVLGSGGDKSITDAIASAPFAVQHSRKTKDELLPIYRDADIFVLPSRTETFGMVYAESISQAVPVVYTKGQGFDGQFPEGEVGFHVDCSNPTDIADTIERIARDYERISARCPNCAKRFDWDLFLDEYSAIYGEATAKHD